MAQITLEEAKKRYGGGSFSTPVNSTPIKTKSKTIEQKPSFTKRISNIFTKRSENVDKILDRDQTLAEKTYQFIGQGAGALGDIAFETVKTGLGAITPDFIEEPIKEKLSSGAKNLLETDAGKAGLNALASGLEDYEIWKKNNPRLAGNLEATINIADAILLARGSSAAKATKVTGEKLIVSGERKAASNLDDFVRKLVQPEQTKKIKELQVPRTTETGVGPFKSSVIAPTKAEELAEQAVKSVPGINSKYTNQQNFNLIQKENQRIATQLSNDLKNNDFIFNKGELKNSLLKAKENLLNNPAIVGDAEKTADKLINEVIRRLESPNYKNKGSDLLRLRKDYDNWVKSQKGANIFDPKQENAFSISNREIRTAINNFLDTKATNVAVKDSLAKQRALYTALDNITPKAAIEADTAFLRTLQRVGNVLGTKNRIVQGIAAGVGIGGLGAAATFAPAAAVLGGIGLLTYKSGKLVLSPKSRKFIGQLLRQAEKIEAKQGLPGLSADLVILKKLLEEKSSVLEGQLILPKQEQTEFQQSRL